MGSARRLTSERQARLPGIKSLSTRHFRWTPCHAGGQASFLVVPLSTTSLVVSDQFADPFLKTRQFPPQQYAHLGDVRPASCHVPLRQRRLERDLRFRFGDIDDGPGKSKNGDLTVTADI